MALTDKLSAIGSAIRAKTGKSGLLTLAQMPTEIASIQTGSSDVPFPLGGMNATKVASYTETWKLEDTSFVVGSTSSTSATTLKASVSNRFTSPSIAIGDKDIVVVQTVEVTPVHSASATGKVQVQKYAVCYVSNISKGRRSVTQPENYVRRTSTQTFPQLRYLNSTGVSTIANTTYGFYATPQAPSVASTSAASTTVRVSSPILYSRASTTYESQANMKTVTDCTWKWNVDVYLVDSQSSVGANIQKLVNGIMFGDN